jgi:2-dehydro-3-deoxygalactonokinase
MSGAGFVAGDWGTSHLRLFLCDAEGAALDSVTGPGAAETGGRFADVLASLVAPWQERYGALPALLCGMVGSSIGWAQAPYVPCPAKPEHIVDACVALHGGTVHIVPGLSCRNRFNAPDFLRGEETQILGAMKLVASLGQGLQLLCLPGTHSKWVLAEDGCVREFFSAPTGELFAVLRDHSVLVCNRGTHDGADSAAFRKGMAHFNEFPQAQLLHRLFECRARQLSGELTAQAAEAYLSGLLIASDVHGALRLLPESVTASPICLVGSSELTHRYAAALTFNGREAHRVDGAAASLAGLAQVHRRLSSLPEVTHEF